MLNTPSFYSYLMEIGSRLSSSQALHLFLIHLLFSSNKRKLLACKDPEDYFLQDFKKELYALK
jgi:hypothetical protein